MIDPNRPESPHKQLTAVGVAFALVVDVNCAQRAAGWHGPARLEPDLQQWLDVETLGTACNVVPLVGVARMLVRQSLSILGDRGNAGLAALADARGSRKRRARSISPFDARYGKKPNAWLHH